MQDGGRCLIGAGRGSERNARATPNRSDDLAVFSEVNCPGGEIGRHAILRGWCRKASRFESVPGHVALPA